MADVRGDESVWVVSMGDIIYMLWLRRRDLFQEHTICSGGANV